MVLWNTGSIRRMVCIWFRVGGMVTNTCTGATGVVGSIDMVRAPAAVLHIATIIAALTAKASMFTKELLMIRHARTN